MHRHGIAEGNDEQAVTHPDGDRFIPAGIIGIEELNEFTVDLRIRQIDKFHAVLRGQRSRDIILRDHAIMDEGGEESVGLDVGASILDLSAGHHSKIPEDFNYVIVVLRHEVY